MFHKTKMQDINHEHAVISIDEEDVALVSFPRLEKEQNQRSTKETKKRPRPERAHII